MTDTGDVTQKPTDRKETARERAEGGAAIFSEL